MSIAGIISCRYLMDRLNAVKQQSQKDLNNKQVQYVCGKCGELSKLNQDFCSRSHDFWICKEDLNNPDLAAYIASASISREKILESLK